MASRRPSPVITASALARRLGEADQVRHEVEAGHDPGAEGGEAPGQPAGGTGAGKRGDVHAETPPEPFGLGLQPARQLLDLLGGGPLLWTKDDGRLVKWGIHVDGDQELDARQAVGSAYGGHGTPASIGGGGPAAADDDPLRAGPDRLEDELADTGGRGAEWIVSLRAARQRQSRRLGHFDDRRPTLIEQAPARRHRPDAVRSDHLDRANVSADDLEQALTPVRHRAGVRGPMGTGCADPGGLGHRGRACGASKLVRCGDEVAHAASFPNAGEHPDRVRAGRLELPPPEGPGPKPGASTGSATPTLENHPRSSPDGAPAR